ncbi:MAG: Rpn family recombination-promoting nuclease/putative transposase [Chlamydiia bacterium]|nr:Rpn family recombination-promoting nuclease/putative transposase [Chlamydiia bacterium]
MVGHKFLNPRNDLAFKRIFGSEKNRDILIHFLNDILQLASPIRELTFLKTIQDPEIAPFRVSIVDVLCQDQDGQRFIIEMQLSHEKGFDRRALYYAARAYCSQRQRIDPSESTPSPAIYADLKNVYFIAITDFTPFPKKENWISRIALKDIETNELDIDAIQLIFLQLPLFHQELHQLRTIRQKWGYFLKHAEETTEEELIQIIGDDAIIQRAYDELSRFKWSEVELNDYESVEMKHAADQAVISAALEKGEKLGLEKGEKLGLEKGEKLGLEKGEKLGLEKGEKLGLEKGEQLGIARRNREIVEIMSKNGMSIEQISQITKLSLEQVIEILKEG